MEGHFSVPDIELGIWILSFPFRLQGWFLKSKVPLTSNKLSTLGIVVADLQVSVGTSWA